jgi:hypothetical protein
MTKDFDNNDLGINFETNYYSLYGNASYRILNPTKYFNPLAHESMVILNFKRNRKDTIEQYQFSINLTTKKNHYFGFRCKW